MVTMNANLGGGRAGFVAANEVNKGKIRSEPSWTGSGGRLYIFWEVAPLN
jgi:hypothetical protein